MSLLLKVVAEVIDSVLASFELGPCDIAELIFSGTDSFTPAEPRFAAAGAHSDNDDLKIETVGPHAAGRGLLSTFKRNDAPRHPLVGPIWHDPPRC